MKYLILNIILFFLISLSVISRDNDAPVVTCVEVHEALYPTFTNYLELDIELITVDSAGNPPNGGIAYLYWETDGDLPEYFMILRNINDVSWDTINYTVPGTAIFYNDTIPDGNCEVYIKYKIGGIDNTTGDTIISNEKGCLFTESIPTEPPILDLVSINKDEYVYLEWTPSPSIDVISTIIYREKKVDNAYTWFPIDTISNDTTYYIDNTVLPCDTNFRYAISALPICGQPSAITQETAQRPILLYEPEYDLCSETISLNWEEYINASDPFYKYEIWLSKNVGEFTVIDTVASSDSSYNHNNIDNATDYAYFVRAVFGVSDFSSTSCTKSIRTHTFIKPEYLYLANANVLPDNNIKLKIDLDLQPNSCTWEILRSDVGGGAQTILTTLSRNSVSISPIIYVDETADGSTGFYTYTINVLDSCGAQTLQSNTMKTVFLEGEQLSDNENYLSWNFFEGFDGEVDKYYIFRILGEVIPTLPIDSTDAQTNEYTDDISVVGEGESKFSYWVQAIEGSQNSNGFNEKSNSNIVSLFRETDLYFPNAFRPDGTNKIFKPVTTGFGGSNYLFQIFNRWGQLIFESTDPELGWDGKYKGNSSPQGTYIYRLVYQNVYNITKQQQGTVTLID